MTSTFESVDPIAIQLARWTAELRYDDLPDEIVNLAKQCVLDTLANVVLGASRERTKPYLRLIQTETPDRVASISMLPEKVSVKDAAFVNAIYAQSCELDDVSDGAGGHPGAVAVPLALALAERDGHDGRAIITGVVAGYEIMYRSISPIFPGSDRRGANGTGVSGPFGAAAVVSIMERLDAATVQQAYGIAGSYSGGLLEYDQTGGEIKRVYPGLGVRGGYEAVELARAGITGPPTVLEGNRGLFHAFGNDIEIDKALDGLGADYRIKDRRAKLFPVVGTIQGSIEAMGRICEQGFAADDVEEIVVGVPLIAVRHGGAVQVPTDMATSQFSFAFSMALCVLYRDNTLDLYEDPTVRERPEVVAMCRRVRVEEVPEFTENAPLGSAVITVRLRDGRMISDTQRPPTGAPGLPMTWGQASEKFHRLTRDYLPVEVRDEIIAIVHTLERLTDASRLAKLMREAGPRT